ncbi:MAG TPA: hypothetical protein DCS21_05150, partial [Gammaproteobacteria bacterium]|nr:hypothetical protein [Gammaproteobacteria bacterium]
MFKNIKLRAKLNFGFAVVIALLIVVTVIACWGLQGASEGFVDYRYRTANAKRVSDLQNHLLSIRLAVKNVVMSGSETALQDYRQHFDLMVAPLKEIQSSIRNPERLKRVAEIGERLTQYNQAFDQVITQVKQRDDSRRRIIEIVQNIEKTVVLLNDSVAVSDDRIIISLANTLHIRFLNSRASFFRFLESHTLEDFAQLQEQVTGMGQVENALNTQAGSVYQAHLNRFRQEYAALTNALPELNQAISQSDDLMKNTLDRIGPEITQITDELVAHIMKDRDALGVAVQDNNNRTLQMIVGISLAAVLIGIALTWLLTRLIQRPLGGEPVEMAELTHRIAAGDLTMRLTDTGKETGIYAAMREMVAELKEIVVQVTQSTNQVSSAATEIAQGSADLSQRTEEQASALEET